MEKSIICIEVESVFTIGIIKTPGKPAVNRICVIGIYIPVSNTGSIGIYLVKISFVITGKVFQPTSLIPVALKFDYPSSSRGPHH
jgi:hypothetical protein